MSLGTTFWPCQIKSSVCWSTSSERTASDDRFWVNCNPFKMTCTKVLSLLKSQLTPIAFLTQKQETWSAIVFLSTFLYIKAICLWNTLAHILRSCPGGKTARVFYCCEWGPLEFGSFGPCVVWKTVVFALYSAVQFLSFLFFLSVCDEPYSTVC